MSYQIKPALMFQDGKAIPAIELYKETFPGSEVIDMELYTAETGPEGTIKQATVRIANQEYLITDSPIPHDFTFTPSSSNFVTCESEEALDTAYAKLSESGETLMPPGDYGFSKKFTWVKDRFGVSWQLNLP